MRSLPLLEIRQFFKGQWKVKPESKANLNMKTGRAQSEILIPEALSATRTQLQRRTSSEGDAETVQVQ
jgi:hypothetical protein